MYRKEINDIGKEIRTVVQDAITSMDFADLNHQIKDSVNEALEEIRSAFSEGDKGDQRENQRAPGGHNQTGGHRYGFAGQQGQGARAGGRGGFAGQGGAGGGQGGMAGQPGAIRSQVEQAAARAREAARRQTEAARHRAEAVRRQMEQSQAAGWRHSHIQADREQSKQAFQKPADLIARRPKGVISNVLCTVFGSVMLAVGVLMALMFGSLALVEGIETVGLIVVGGIVVAPLCGGGIFMLSKGARDRARLERFCTYVNVIWGQKYVKIQDLAAAVHKTEKYVRKDLRKMISLGMFPQGHISKAQNLFILDHETYTQYETMSQEVEPKKNIQEEKREESREEGQLRETMERGRDYLAAIRKANDAIPGVEISEKLSRLEKSVGRIYAQIRKTPEKLPELRRFQEYYLPTTLKLVETYREFDAQPIAGENITTAKTEIEASLDTINQAFEKLFDSLFADTAMDVSADISVLQTLLAQEGLTEEAWKAATETDAEYMWDFGEAQKKAEESGSMAGQGAVQSR